MFKPFIEDNVPAPMEKGEISNFIRSVEIGQSFVVNEEEWMSIKNAQHWLSKHDGIVIAIRTVNKSEGLHRVWRLK